MSFRLWRLLRSQAFGGLGCRLREGFTAKEARLVVVGAKAENVWLCAPCLGVVCTYVLALELIETPNLVRMRITTGKLERDSLLHLPLGSNWFSFTKSLSII